MTNLIQFLPKQGNFILFAFKDSGFVHFQLPNDITELEDKTVRQNVASHIFTQLVTSQFIDEILLGEDSRKIYSMKRTIPNRKCQIFVSCDGELVSTRLGTREFSTKILHDVVELPKIISLCLSYIGGSSLSLISTKVPKEHTKKEPKKLTAAELEEIKRKKEEREKTIALIKEQRESMRNALKAQLIEL